MSVLRAGLLSVMLALPTAPAGAKPIPQQVSQASQTSAATDTQTYTYVRKLSVPIVLLLGRQGTVRSQAHFCTSPQQPGLFVQVGEQDPRPLRDHEIFLLAPDKPLKAQGAYHTARVFGPYLLYVKPMGLDQLPNKPIRQVFDLETGEEVSLQGNPTLSAQLAKLFRVPRPKPSLKPLANTP